MREKANAIPTLWTITKENREVLEQAGTILLHQHPCFQRLLLDMDIKADFIDAAFANAQAPFWYDTTGDSSTLSGGTQLTDMPNSYSCFFLRRTESLPSWS